MVIGCTCACGKVKEYLKKNTGVGHSEMHPPLNCFISRHQ